MTYSLNFRFSQIQFLWIHKNRDHHIQISSSKSQMSKTSLKFKNFENSGQNRKMLIAKISQVDVQWRNELMLDSIGRQEKWLLLESKFFNAVAKNFMCSWIDISYSFIWVTCDSKYRVNIVIPKNIPAAKCGPNTGRGFLWDGLKSSREAWLTWDHMHKVWRCCKKVIRNVDQKVPAGISVHPTRPMFPF